jgi:hypothetical protein
MVEKEKLGNKKKYNAKEITVKTQCWHFGYIILSISLCFSGNNWIILHSNRKLIRDNDNKFGQSWKVKSGKIKINLTCK